MSRLIPTDTTELRRLNTAQVLTALRRDGPSTRTALAERTGLAKATVGSIVADLEQHGAVSEHGPVAGGRGRPGRPVGLTGRPGAGIGLEVNVDYLAAVAIDVAGTTLASEVVSVDPADPLSGLGPLLTRTRETVEAAGLTVLGTVCAVPGTGLGGTPNLAAGADTVAERLALLAPGPVGAELENDANCAALAEVMTGALVGVRDAIYLTGTVGIGAGVVLDGRLHLGERGLAGEVGHMPLGRPGVACGCGRTGCWETAVGLRALLDGVGVPDDDTPVRLAAAIASRAGEPVVDAALDRLVAEVARGLAVLTSVMDPSRIVLGGYFAALGPAWADRVGDAVADLLPAGRPTPQVLTSELGLHAAARGAAEHALTTLYAGGVGLKALS